MTKPTCTYCKADISHRSPKAKFCSNECRNNLHRASKPKRFCQNPDCNVNLTMLGVKGKGRWCSPECQPECSADGCENQSVKGSGLCPKHHSRRWRYGHLDRLCKTCGIDVSDKHTSVAYCSEECRPKCSVKHCTDKSDTHGMCLTHVYRMRRQGHPYKDCIVCGVDLVVRKGANTYCDDCIPNALRRPHKMPISVLIERDGIDCGICHEPVDINIPWPERGSPSVDHIIPWSRGGTHDPENLRLTHMSCNRAKWDKVDYVHSQTEATSTEDASV